METRIFKIIFSLLLLTIPTLYYANNVTAKQDFIFVSKSKIDLSPEHLVDYAYLNSEEIKCYILNCIIEANCLTKESVEEIEIKLKHINLFCICDHVYDREGRAILRIWVPRDIPYTCSSAPGTLYSIPMQYEI